MLRNCTPVQPVSCLQHEDRNARILPVYLCSARLCSGDKSVGSDGCVYQGESASHEFDSTTTFTHLLFFHQIPQDLGFTFNPTVLLDVVYPNVNVVQGQTLEKSGESFCPSAERPLTNSPMSLPIQRSKRLLPT